MGSLTPAQEWIGAIGASALAAAFYVAYPNIGGPFVAVVALAMLVYASDKGYLGSPPAAEEKVSTMIPSGPSKGL